MAKKGSLSSKTVRLEFVADQIYFAVLPFSRTKENGEVVNRHAQAIITAFARRCVGIIAQGGCPYPEQSPQMEGGPHWLRVFRDTVFEKLVLRGVEESFRETIELLYSTFPRKLRKVPPDEIGSHLEAVAMYAAQSACVLFHRLDPRILDIRKGQRSFVQLLVH